ASSVTRVWVRSKWVTLTKRGSRSSKASADRLLHSWSERRFKLGRVGGRGEAVVKASRKMVEKDWVEQPQKSMAFILGKPKNNFCRISMLMSPSTCSWSKHSLRLGKRFRHCSKVREVRF